MFEGDSSKDQLNKIGLGSGGQSSTGLTIQLHVKKRETETFCKKSWQHMLSSKFHIFKS